MTERGYFWISLGKSRKVLELNFQVNFLTAALSHLTWLNLYRAGMKLFHWFFGYSLLSFILSFLLTFFSYSFLAKNFQTGQLYLQKLTPNVPRKREKTTTKTALPGSPVIQTSWSTLHITWRISATILCPCRGKFFFDREQWHLKLSLISPIDSWCGC